jgi:predicted O-methyltransferase YrrM
MSARTRTARWAERAAWLRREATAAGVDHLLTAGAVAGVAARVLGAGPRGAATLSLLGILTARERLASRHALVCEIRNAADAPGVMAALPAAAQLGDFAIDHDFAKVLLRALAQRPEVVVECGSGASTLLTAESMTRGCYGRLYSIESDARYARFTREALDAAGVGERVELIVAPLRRQVIGGESVEWFDLGAVRAAGIESVDLLVVDGPPTRDDLSRWPALEVFSSLLAAEGTVLLDDGRRAQERSIAFRWSRDHPGMELSWIDTIKGAWQLERKPSASTGDSRSSVVLRRGARSLNPNPRGFGLVPVPR